MNSISLLRKLSDNDNDSGIERGKYRKIVEVTGGSKGCATKEKITF